MVCCKNLFRRSAPSARSVICLKLVVPLRILALSSITADVIFTLSRHGHLSPRQVFLSFINILLCWLIIGECRKSVDYHRRIAASENKGAGA